MTTFLKQAEDTVQTLTKTVVALGALLIGLSFTWAAADSPVESPDLALFAVEVKTGPNWDPSKAPHEQAFFKEHSQNLQLLRTEGHIVMGARYSDIGLLIFSAASADDVQKLMNKDPSIAAGTFVIEVHAMNVFYPGLVQVGQ